MTETIQGFIYALSNESFEKNIFKIGKTKYSPYERAKKLSSETSAPLPFKVEFFIRVTDITSVESQIKNELKKYRVNITNDRKEFFKLEPSLLIDVFKKHEPEWNKREKITLELPSWIVSQLNEMEYGLVGLELIVESLLMNKYGWKPEKKTI